MKRYVMEFVGTMLFVFSILSFITMGTGAMPATLAIGMTLMTLVYMGGSVSGAHYNPAVTLALYLRKKINLHDSIAYVVSQLLGAVVAALVVRLIFHAPMPINIQFDALPIFVAELIFTFALASVVLHVAASKATSGNSYFGLAIGTIVTVGATAVGSISGGFFNPAVYVGLATGSHIPHVYLLGLTVISANLIGAAGAALLHKYSEK